MKKLMSVALMWFLAATGVSAAVTYGKVYWSDNQAHCLQRANLDGKQIETVVANSGRPWGVAIDAVNARLYWADNDPYALPVIARCNLDGSAMQVLISEPWNSGMQFPQFIALDEAGGKLYYTSGNTRSIERANFDGTGRETILHADLNGPVGIALDLTNRYLYWTHIMSTHSRICRSRLDGTETVQLLYQQGFFYGIGLDVASGHMYWADQHPNYLAIRRANFDGSNPISIVSGVQPSGIALDLTDRKVYWATRGIPSIQRANLDGTGVETIISRANVPGLDYTMDVAIIHLPEPDTTPPEVSCTVTPGVLWPPNHRMAAVEISIRATDEGTPSPEDLLSTLRVTITSTQPDTGLHDGNTAGDVNGSDGFSSPVDVSSLFTLDPVTGNFVATVRLRAETAMHREPRVYSVVASVTDGAGNAGTCREEVLVGKAYKPFGASSWSDLNTWEPPLPAFGNSFEL